MEQSMLEPDLPRYSNYSQVAARGQIGGAQNFASEALYKSLIFLARGQICSARILLRASEALYKSSWWTVGKHIFLKDFYFSPQWQMFNGEREKGRRC